MSQRETTPPGTAIASQTKGHRATDGEQPAEASQMATSGSAPRLDGHSSLSHSRPRLLDLFCGAGGCSEGYDRAGFEVVGVDLSDQPNYRFDFFQANALTVLRGWDLGAYDAIHASAPCPRYSLVSGFHGVAKQHPDLIAPVRHLLNRTGLPYVLENVPGAPLRKDLVLCGEQFGLRVHRHRIFETSGFFVMQQKHQKHKLRGAKTNCEKGDGIARWITGNYADHQDACDAMGVDWEVTRRELANAIPPAYTQFIGEALYAHVIASIEVAA